MGVGDATNFIIQRICYTKEFEGKAKIARSANCCYTKEFKQHNLCYTKEFLDTLCYTKEFKGSGFSVVEGFPLGFGLGRLAWWVVLLGGAFFGGWGEERSCEGGGMGGFLVGGVSGRLVWRAAGEPMQTLNLP